MDIAILDRPLQSLPILEVYLRVRQSEDAKQAYWRSVRTALQQDLSKIGLGALRHVQRISKIESLPSTLDNANLDQEILSGLKQVLQSGSIPSEDIVALTTFIKRPVPFATDDFSAEAVSAIARIAEDVSLDVLHGRVPISSLEQGLLVPLQLLDGIDDNLLHAAEADSPVAATAYEILHLICTQDDAVQMEVIEMLASSLWTRLSSGKQGLDTPDLAALVASRLGGLLLESDCLSSYVKPAHRTRALTKHDVYAAHSKSMPPSKSSLVWPELMQRTFCRPTYLIRAQCNSVDPLYSRC